MGLFAHRPEEPTEWAGLPSEPERERSEAERLGEQATVDVGLTGLLGEATGAIESIVIPVAPAVGGTGTQEAADGAQPGDAAGRPRLEP